MLMCPTCKPHVCRVCNWDKIAMPSGSGTEENGMGPNKKWSFSAVACSMSQSNWNYSIVVKFPILWAVGIVSVPCNDRNANYQSVQRKFSSTSCCLTNDLGLYGPKMGRLPTYLSRVFCLDHSYRMPEKWLTVAAILLTEISWLFLQNHEK